MFRSPPRPSHRALLAAAVLGLLSGGAMLRAQSDEPHIPAPDVVDDAPPTSEIAAFAEDFRLPPGVTVELVAAEPLLQHPVAFSVDERGRLFVAETHRVHVGVTDIREHMDWLDDDLAAMTVEDRVAYMQRQTGEDFDTYEQASDRVRLLLDTDDDGLYDAARTFATGFAAAADGIGAGVLARDGEVFYTCIPSLWRLADTDDDGVADERAALSSGYGVRITLLGHDLHGVLMGPDGRLWFSVGDRGLHVETPEGLLSLPDQGAVLRCEPDGSQLELVHTGLRNPQELAFDDFGNLFTVDNNSDAGDQARLVQILAGAESGWRQPFQWLDDRGPWKNENWWRAEQHDIFFRLPPLGHVGSGPSGLLADPGELFPAPFTGGLLLADFLGGASYSAVLGIELERDGAGFELGAVRPFVEGVLPTDVELDPQGRVLISDWVEGWGHTSRGRIWRVSGGDSRQAADGARRAAELARPFTERDEAELLGLLGDPDRRLRDRAHLELAARPQSLDALRQLLATKAEPLPRWHALWSLGVAARRSVGLDADALLAEIRALGLATDSDPELRALSCRVLGDVAPDLTTTASAQLAALLTARLHDSVPHVRLAAALAAAELNAKPEPESALSSALRARLAEDVDDPSLLHGLSYALSRHATAEHLATLRSSPKGPARGVRLGALLALRHQRSAELTVFLRDPDPMLRAAAARALWDTGLATDDTALAQALSERLEMPSPTDADIPVLRRALAAAQRLGSSKEARRVLAFAERDDAPLALRGVALDVLLAWGESGDRDLVLGHRSLRPAFDTAPLVEALRGSLGEPRSDDAPELLERWVELAAAHELREAAPLLESVMRSRAQGAALRSRAFETLDDWSTNTSLERAARVSWALGDRNAELRAVALERLAELGEERLLEHLPALARSGTLPERRVAYQLAAELEDSRGALLLQEQWQRQADGELPVELLLDLIEATPSALSSERAATLSAAREQGLGAPLEAMLFGGDAHAGRELFERTELACVRCHAREAGAGDEESVGPSLHDVGRRLGRRQLFSSLRDPNADLAPGFLNTHLFLIGGDLITGRVLEEDAEQLALLDAEGHRHEVALADIETRREALSAMPEGLVATLTPLELRDLVAYLAEL